MLQYFRTKRVKQPELKLPYQEYIYTAIKPSRDVLDELQARLETELKGNIKDMRQEFRLMTKKIRSLYIPESKQH